MEGFPIHMRKHFDLLKIILRKIILSFLVLIKLRIKARSDSRFNVDNRDSSWYTPNRKRDTSLFFEGQTFPFGHIHLTPIQQHFDVGLRRILD